MGWVSEEAATAGLMALMDTLWQDAHFLMADLLYLTQNNAWERQSRVDWSSEYDLLTIHYLRCLTPDLNTL